MESVYTLGKPERINSKTEINHLFLEGKSFVSYPLRVRFICMEPGEGVAISVMASVPKKKFKKAVKRNRLKRLIKESYRLHKYELIDHLNLQNKRLLIAFIYIAEKEKSFSEIEDAVCKSFSTLIDQVK